MKKPLHMAIVMRGHTAKLIGIAIGDTMWNEYITSGNITNHTAVEVTSSANAQSLIFKARRWYQGRAAWIRSSSESRLPNRRNHCVVPTQMQTATAKKLSCGPARNRSEERRVGKE